jgi:hypothetical protein
MTRQAGADSVSGPCLLASAVVDVAGLGAVLAITRKHPVPMFFLHPVEQFSEDPAWDYSRTKESCYVVASTEDEARSIAAGCLVNAPETDLPPRSPWLTGRLVMVGPVDAPISVPTGVVVTVTGQTFSPPFDKAGHG